MNAGSFRAIASVARKEFLHIYRDRRVLILLLVLPPVFTLVFGHAFEVEEMTNVPALLINSDATPRTERFVDRISKNPTFRWKQQQPGTGAENDLLGHRVQAALVIPGGWSEGLANGKPLPLQLYLDASDTNVAPQLLGSVQETLGEFQLTERQ
ncbi:MAG: ABC transporter permease, partial [Chthoniobacterales bacterium]|nr:ABC transporter permease [Chthoniobacterales bacterium]